MKYDRDNVIKFKSGCHIGYRCNLCGEGTTYDASYSNKGYRLICEQCYWKLYNLLGPGIVLERLHRPLEDHEVLFGKRNHDCDYDEEKTEMGAFYGKGVLNDEHD